MKHYLISIYIFLTVILAAISCNPDELDPDPDALPSFSADTISFDTVFTTIGSATLSFKIYNTSNRPLIIQSIDLAGGSESFFRLNIDGEPLTHATNVKIPPDDSLFVFLAVTVDPANSNNPVVIKDSVVFLTNGTLQNVKLIAYGQDVHLIKSAVIGSEIWENDKPYLIYNYMVVDTGATLTIQPGTRIYLHRNAFMVVWGTLISEGNADEPVIFQNDRLEEFYRTIPGQWGTIFFDPISQGNKINHTYIINAIAGIQIGYPSDYSVPELEISNSYILNTGFAGIYAFGANITCYNTIIANSAGPAVALLRGGDYSFYHCTIANFGVPGASRSTPAVVMSNFFNNSEYSEDHGQYETVVRTDDLRRAEFINSIIWGTYAHEVQISSTASKALNYQFDYCLLRVSEDSISGASSPFFTNLVLNKDPLFVNDSDRYHLNFSLDTLSPAKDMANPVLLQTYPFLNSDFEGKSRIADSQPDLGAIERKED